MWRASYRRSGGMRGRSVFGWVGGGLSDELLHVWEGRGRAGHSVHMRGCILRDVPPPFATQGASINASTPFRPSAVQSAMGHPCAAVEKGQPPGFGLGGWVGGWVGGREGGGWNELLYAREKEGGWVGGWVGGWDGPLEMCRNQWEALSSSALIWVRSR